MTPHISLPATLGFQPPPCAIGEETPESIPYQNLLGCLMHIIQKCRPDVLWTVATLSQFTKNHSYVHFKASMKALMYLGTVKNLGIKFEKSDSPLQITCYVDASLNSTISDHKSWTGYCILLNKMPISWCVVKQTKVAASPMEAQYIAAAEAAKL